MTKFLLIFALLTAAALGSVKVGTHRGSTAFPTPTPEAGQSFEKVKDFLLSAAAKDFHEHHPTPARFRNARIGHVGDGKEASYRLCGEFLPADRGDKAGWMFFATIKTDGYEQYIGDEISNFCATPKMVWDTARDISPELKTRFDALR